MQRKAQPLHRRQQQPGHQRRDQQTTDKTTGGQQAQLDIARLPEQQCNERRHRQRITCHSKCLRRLLLTPDHTIVRHASELEHRRQRKTQQQQ